MRAAFLMRLVTTSEKAIVRVVARNILISAFGCDASPGAEIKGGLYLPHPIGIVIGSGVVLEENVRVFQGVTLGAGRGGYPTIGAGSTIFPNSMIVGGVTIGASSRIGAGNFVSYDVPPGTTIRAHGKPLA